ncbi:MAG: hypothetical protein E6357_30085 [Clostridiales bacterium]|nr:hypothetical protein [Clostridiales bacterium]
MKMKSREIEKKLSGLLNLKDKTFPREMSYAISRNIENLTKEYERIGKERIDICELYAKKDKDGNAITETTVKKNQYGQEVKETNYVFESPEDERMCTKDYQEVLETETDISIFTITLEMFEKCEEVDRYSVPTVGEEAALIFMTEEAKKK